MGEAIESPQPSELNGQAVLFLSYGNETLEDLMRRDLIATQLRASLAHCTSGNALTLQAQGATLLSRIEEYTANDRFDELRIIDLERKREGSIAYHTEREMQEVSNAAYLRRVRSEHLGWPMDPPGGFSMPLEQWKKRRKAQEKRDRRMARRSLGDRTGTPGAMYDLSPGRQESGGTVEESKEDRYPESSGTEVER